MCFVDVAHGPEREQCADSLLKEISDSILVLVCSFKNSKK
jgi:hypothetical protein